MSIRDQLHSLIDQLPDHLLPVVLTLLRQLIATDAELAELDTDDEFGEAVWSDELEGLEDPDDFTDFTDLN